MVDIRLIPKSECLKDSVARVLPYWYDFIVPEIKVEYCYTSIVMVTGVIYWNTRGSGAPLFELNGTVPPLFRTKR